MSKNRKPFILYLNLPPMKENAHPDWVDPKMPDLMTIIEVGRRLGYAITFHGSMRRDVDIVAIPWVEKYSTHKELVDILCTALNGMVIGEYTEKPNGRIACTIQVKGYYRLIDLSIIRP